MAFIIKNNDASITVMFLAGDAAQAVQLAPECADIVVQAEIDVWPEEYRCKAVSFRAMPDANLPRDLTFREAWRDNGGDVIEFDMDACRQIWRDKMRAARKPKLEALDIEFQRAIEVGAPITDIVARKQALRDCTELPDIESAQTPDDLKEVWPPELN